MGNAPLATIDHPAMQLVGFPIEHDAAPAGDVLRRRRGIVFLCTAAGLGIALAITALQPPRYSATSSIQIEEQGTKVFVEAEPISDPFDNTRQLNTQVDLLRSRALAGLVVNSLDLAESPSFYRAMGSPQTDNFKTTSAKLKEDRAVDLLVDNVTVDLPKDSRVAQVTFTSRNPQLSADVANAYGTSLIKLDQDRRYASLSYARDYLDEEIGKAGKRLEASQRELNSYARSAGLIHIGNAEPVAGGSASTVTQSSLLQLNQALSLARAQRIDAQERLGAALSGSVFSVPEVAQNSTVQNLLTDRALEETKVAEIEGRYTAEHPSSVAGRARLDRINEQLNGVADSVRQSLQRQYSAARGAESALEGQVASLKSRSMSEQDKSVRFNLLKHEADTNQAMYDMLLQRQREVGTSVGITPNNISVLDAAAVPLLPSSPKPIINAIAGMLIGLILGIALAIFRDRTDDRIARPEDLKRQLQLTSLGQIPYVRGPSDEAFIEGLADSNSRLGNSFTALRTRLLLSNRKGLPNSIVVTSPARNAGRSTTALALARSLASSGKYVLLVEGDMKNQPIGEMLGLDSEWGLSDLLSGRLQLVEAVQHTAFDYLDALPGGSVSDNPTDLLDPSVMRAILDEAEKHYGCIVIDAPAVDELGDAALLAAAAGNVILVIPARAGQRKITEAAKEMLESAGARILGGVLASAPSTRDRYRHKRSAKAKRRAVDADESHVQVLELA